MIEYVVKDLNLNGHIEDHRKLSGRNGFGKSK